jgi:CotH kinase protein
MLRTLVAPGLGRAQCRRWRRAAGVLFSLSTALACTQHKSHRPSEALLPDNPKDAIPSAPPGDDVRAQGSAYLFDPEQLRTFELRLNEEDLAFLDADPKAEEYVPGELSFEGQRLQVGIRYKGSTGSFFGCLSGGGFPPTGAKSCPKLSMKVKIDYGDPEAKFYGQKKLLFHAMNSDRSLLRERLGYGLFQEMGVSASRTVHVRLLINGQLSGLYLLVEEIDGRFTRSRFGDGGHGNLYKEVWPVGDDEARYRDALETNRDEDPSVDKMLAFAGALREADDETLPDVLARWMDTDYVARYVAVDRAIRHDDGPYHWYCQAAAITDNADWHRQARLGDSYCGNHNYYWYEGTRADRLWLIPWDLDNALPARPGFTFVQSAWDDLSYDCSTTLPGVLGTQMPVTCDPLLRAFALSLSAAIESALRELLAGPMSERTTSQKIARWSEQIAPIVAEASELYPREPTISSWLNELTLLQSALDRLRSEALPEPAADDSDVSSTSP